MALASSKQCWVLIAAMAGSLLLTACAGGVRAEAEPTPTLSAVEQEGKRLFSQYCGSCHATSGDTVIVGPSMAGIAGRAGDRVDGMNAHDYLKTSVMDPKGYLVEGYKDLMPTSLATALGEEELEAIISYLMTLE